MKCILVVSPGGNGNHMWDRILQLAGSVKYGDTECGDVMMDGVPTEPLIHWFRSLPSLRYELDVLESMVASMRAAGYDVFGLVPVRNWFCAAGSQKRRHGVNGFGEVVHNMRVGYPHILSTYQRLDVPWMFAVYSEAIHQSDYIHWVLNFMGLPSEIDLGEIKDENSKWWSGVNRFFVGAGGSFNAVLPYLMALFAGGYVE